MTREIKFRGKSVDGQLVYGIPIKTHIGTYMITEENPHVCSVYGYMEIDEFVKINEDTIGQFTGLHDKNGKEIYEGDIFHLGSKSILYQVVWHDTGLIGKQIHASCYAGLEHWKEKILVIGNIYDNPELLKLED